ncbi:MAG: carboxypeptidase-like regulatory domain-containing protein, partial [Flavisolibacter sp.]|nr:carboxypeptidase-like regulatory domain-containing protein [Flavisolibacter sp.]
MYLLKENDVAEMSHIYNKWKWFEKLEKKHLFTRCILVTALLCFHLLVLANDGNTSNVHKKKSEINFIATAGAWADTTIHGRVTDSTGAPLSGISVTVRGTQNGTTTNAAGEFVLRGVPNNATLEISSVGYETQEIAIRAGQHTVAVTLRRNQGMLGDVIVTG